jgi:hypothetical protein
MKMTTLDSNAVFDCLAYQSNDIPSLHEVNHEARWNDYGSHHAMSATLDGAATVDSDS